jgi:hypothetical protein
MAPAAAA